MMEIRPMVMDAIDFARLSKDTAALDNLGTLPNAKKVLHQFAGTQSSNQEKNVIMGISQVV